MDTVKLKRNNIENDLSAALDKSVEAALALGIPENDLIFRFMQRMYQKAPNNIVPIRTASCDDTYNPEAGP